jgi:Mrp family chromosome partitioning ATPase
MVRRKEELQVVGRLCRADAAVASEMVEACSLASLQMGGPTLRSVGVASAIRGEGRTSVALAMAVVQQRDYRRRALLLEMDFDRPSLSHRLAAEAAPGLAELVRGEASLGEVLQPLPDGPTVMTAGAAAGAAARLIVDLMRSGLLQDLSQQFDVVVVDLPPILGSTVAGLAAGLFERTLLVIRAGVTPLPQIREATASLPSEPVILLNGTNTRLPPWIRRLAGA